MAFKALQQIVPASLLTKIATRKKKKNTKSQHINERVMLPFLGQQTGL